MRVALFIPARYGSTRFPGKPLAPLHKQGMASSLIYWTWVAANKVKQPRINVMSVATDSVEIHEAVSRFGRVIMTSDRARNGTERCFEAAEEFNLGQMDIVVNLQGDSPLIPPSYITKLINGLVSSDADVATAVVNLAPSELVEGTVTCAMDSMSHALYFSRHSLPHGGDCCHAHVGLYAYRVRALERYARAELGPLERAESLEQLRWLEQELSPVHCAQVEPIIDKDGNKCIPPEVNYQSDIELVEELL